MSDTSLSISFSSAASGVVDSNARRYVHLEQVIDTVDEERSATMTDIAQMISRVKSGISAHTYKTGECSFTYINNIFSTWFHFYVWPSSTTLAYDLSSDIGVIDHGAIVKEKVTFSVIFELENSVELDFLLENITYVKETPFYSADGSVLYDVTLQMNEFTTIVAN